MICACSLFFPSVSALALDILWYILAFMPPAISPTSSSCAYRKLCRMRTTSTCTSCRTRSLQDCRFTPRMAQMAAAVSIFFFCCLSSFSKFLWYTLRRRLVSSVRFTRRGIFCLQQIRVKIYKGLRVQLLNFYVSVLAGSKWKIKPESTQYQCQNGSLVAHDDGHIVDCLQIRTVERAVEKGTQEVRPAESHRRPSPPKTVESRDLAHCVTGRTELSTTPENLPQDEQGGKVSRTAKNSSPKARRGTNTPSPPAGRTEKKQRASSKTVSPNWDGTDKSVPAAQNHHAEQIRCGSVLPQSSTLLNKPDVKTMQELDFFFFSP